MTATIETALELAPEIVTPRSVVASPYKLKYAMRAQEARKPKAVSLKAAARCNGDWLAFELAKRTLTEANKLNVPAFEAILDANGVAHAHWNRTTKGWEGRLRMTGRLALQRAVASEEALYLPEGDAVTPPRTWLAKFQS